MTGWQTDGQTLPTGIPYTAYQNVKSMKLQNVITFRMSILKAISIALWAVFFYFAIINEINDKTDEALTNYAETLITNYLADGNTAVAESTGGGRHHMRKVTAEYAASVSHIRYKDKEMFFASSGRYAPARTVTYIFRTDDGQWRELVAFTTTIDKDDLKRAILYWLVALYVVLLLGIIAVNMWTVRHSMKPLKALLDWFEAYQLGRGGKPLGIKTKVTEFRKLNDAVSRSVERNEQQYEQQKLFIANASHEMQTPLAVCTNRLEMLLDEDNLTETQMADIIKTLRTLKNLAATNRSLLLLCKIDNRQFAEGVTVNLKLATEKALQGLETVYSYRHISVSTDLEADTAATMDESLAGILVGNLLKNAFVHNVEGGHITVSSSGNVYSVANTGAPAPLDESKIFERFYHSADKKSSTGLGLALVKAICNLYGFKIEYAFREGLHTFTVTFG